MSFIIKLNQHLHKILIQKDVFQNKKTSFSWKNRLKEICSYEQELSKQERETPVKKIMTKYHQMQQSTFSNILCDIAIVKVILLKCET
jgi:hypothetical protein